MRRFEDPPFVVTMPWDRYERAKAYLWIINAAVLFSCCCFPFIAIGVGISMFVPKEAMYRAVGVSEEQIQNMKRNERVMAEHAKLEAQAKIDASERDVKRRRDRALSH
ncbi:MAG: hypothetical protein HC852_22640 [Acaryochloridaceae cyanobacterium RU_4_10]|nr:hypothetical protein [Acaryochloridaceae cyanobacterium RU_4_10]